MAAIVFLQIGSTDLTQYVDIQNVEINSTEVVNKWTDGNYTDHEDVVGTRIAGTLKLGFADLTEFSNFKSLLSSNRNANGYYPIKIYVNNLNSTETINAFITLKGTAKWNIKNGRQWLVQTMEVRQREVTHA